MLDRIPRDLLEQLQATDFDPRLWLTHLIKTESSYIKDSKRLEDLQWTLRQLEAQYATEFEAKAEQFKDGMPKMHSVWSKCVSDEQTGLFSLQQRYDEVLSQMKLRLGSLEFEAFNKMIALEKSRTALSRMKQMLENEKEWRRIVADFQLAVESKDLDSAQARLEALDRLSETIKSDAKATRLGQLKQAFVAAIRNS